jgi:hypothetical protein
VSQTEHPASTADLERGRRDNALRLLRALGAGGVAHLDGTLLEHLERTESLLRSWGCSETVSIAGLCHATYGTDGFPVALLAIDRRQVLSEAVGSDVEALVYLYASCDRRSVYPVLADGRRDFQDRFTSQTFMAPEETLRDFVDLTLANESDVGIIGPSADHPPDWLLSMFRQLEHLASATVCDGFRRLTSPDHELAPFDPRPTSRISRTDDVSRPGPA